MTILTDYQFEILPNADAADGFVFGIGAGISLNDGGFDPGETSWTIQDQQNDRRGVLGFGRDVRSPRTWVWGTHTNKEDAATAVDILDQFSAAWAPDELVRTPGALTAIRYRIAGRNRRVFGRPRRFAAPPTNLIMNGFVPITHDFQCVDSYTYDDLESSSLILYNSSVSGGGFTLPATLPVNTIPSKGNGSAQLAVGGNARAYPIVRFNGPWTNPAVSDGNWTLSWTGSVATGGWVQIDCRPWMLTVMDQSGASRAGGLPRQTWLEDYWFAPGSRPQMSLDGAAASGSASALVRWRNTWTSI